MSSSATQRGHRTRAILSSLLPSLLLLLLMMGDAVAWIDGTPFFYEISQSLPPSPPPSSAPALAANPRFQLGQQVTFYAIDFRQQTQYTVGASLRSIGDFCYVFVEDDQWQRNVTAGVVERIRRAFDDSTPADAGRGIYEIETAAFGPPADIDGDPRVLILLLDVRDSFVHNGGFIAGYFSPVNQQLGVVRDPNHGVPFRSNEAEMIYLDVDPLDVTSASGLSVLAHEFQHLIHWNYDTNEDVWVNEGCSDYAIFLCGYSVGEHVRAFEEDPEASLVVWNSARTGQLPHYGAAYLWMLYLHEHFGGEHTITAIVHEQRNGALGVSTALSSRGYTSDFSAVFTDWQLANHLDDPALEDGQYGYRHVELDLDPTTVHDRYPVARSTRQLPAWGSDTLLFTNGVGGGSLIVDMVEPLARVPLQVRAVEYIGNQPVGVRRVDLSDMGHGYLSVERFGLQTDQVLLLTAFEPLEPGDQTPTAKYEVEARMGEQVSFQVNLIQNPVHPRYWEVLARASHRIGADRPRITITESGAARLENQPMGAVQDGILFGQSVYVPSGRLPDRIHWRVEYFGALVGEGVLGENAP